MMRQIYNISSFIFVYLGLALYSGISLAQEDRMIFVFHPPKFLDNLMGTAWTIYADGPIDANAADRFDQMVRQKSVPMYSTVYLNSPGGSVIAGIELGRAFRRYGFNTSVGKFNRKANRPSSDAYCMSSCALAYIGGVFRYMEDNSVYGVHRFYFTDKINNAEDVAQIISAQIIKYLSDHSIKPDFFVGMSKARPDEIFILSKADLEVLGIVNNGFENERWNIKSLQSDSISLLYLIGERKTHFGINKLMIGCLPSKMMYLHVIFDPQGRQDQVIHMNAQSLLVDEQAFRFTDFATVRPTIHNAWLNAAYLIPNSLLDRIASAETLGFAFQAGYEAPTFLGFSGLKFDEGRELFKGLRASCMN